MIDIQSTSEEEIEKMVDLGVLRGVFIALKHGHEKNFFKKDMEKVLKFVETLPIQYVFQSFFKMLLEYMQRRSDLEDAEFNKIVEQKLEPDMATNFKTIFENAEERAEKRGEQKGIAIGEQKGIAIGEQKGIAIGEQKGIAIGEAMSKEILNRAITVLLRTTSLTDIQIAKELETEESSVKAIREGMNLVPAKKKKKV